MKPDDIYAILNKKIKNLQVSGGGITDYRELTDKPSINEVELIGQLSLEDLGIKEMSIEEVDEIIKNLGGI